HYLYGADGRTWLDLIGGISVCNTGHRHPRVVAAIKEQADRYLHLIVYGELIQSPQVEYARLLASHLPPSLDSVYFTNSGAEATEGAMKLAKRVTGRQEIVACRQSYHGSTQGALSIMGDEYWRNAFRPLLPGIRHVDYNSTAALEAITMQTACIIIETVQAERGVYVPDGTWLQQLRHRCDLTGTLLVFDEIQAGFGRTGTLWGFERYGVVPDILLLGKALGGGLPMAPLLPAGNVCGCSRAIRYWGISPRSVGIPCAARRVSQRCTYCWSPAGSHRWRKKKHYSTSCSFTRQSGP